MANIYLYIFNPNMHGMVKILGFKCVHHLCAIYKKHQEMKNKELFVNHVKANISMAII